MVGSSSSEDTEDDNTSANDRLANASNDDETSDDAEDAEGDGSSDSSGAMGLDRMLTRSPQELVQGSQGKGTDAGFLITPQGPAPR